MGKTWTKLDLEGGGLQSANLRLAIMLKKHGTAYALLALFPLGLHRDYLQDRRGAWLYRGASGLGIAAYLLGQPVLSLVLLAALAAGAIYDLLQIDGNITRINKVLRMQVYLGQSAGAPAGFKGNYTDSPREEDLKIKDQEHTARVDESVATGSRAPRVLSFNEQEKLLRELAQLRQRNDK